MLKYTLNRNNVIDDNIKINIFSYEVLGDVYGEDDKIAVTFKKGNDSVLCELDERVECTIVNRYTNDDETDDNLDDITDTQSLKTNVYLVNKEEGTFTLLVPKYREIMLDSVEETIDDNNIKYWEFHFEKGHFFEKYYDNIELLIYYNNNKYDYVHLTNLEYVNCRLLQWKVDDQIIGFNELQNMLFSNSLSSLTSIGVPLLNYIQVKRTQTLFNPNYNYDVSPFIYFTVNRPKTNITIPFSLKTDINLLSQEVIDNTFVRDELGKVVPDFNEMEKVVYTPFVRSKNGKYQPINKINFNLHFRTHTDENWTVKDTDGWNFSEYGYTQAIDKYYSYGNQSNQSDLLGYLGFTLNDVRYQKNVLKKSFLRLQYFDSPDEIKQNLLCYSTVFFNTGNLYSKYMRNQNTGGLYIKENDGYNTFNNISVDREINKSKLPTNIRKNDELIENFRLSSQLSVTDKYTSHISSEGFYIYLWADNKTDIPESIHMKVEFNHAGYGRTIPMMMPYFIDGVDNGVGIKTNEDIKSDWDNDGYGINKYKLYSYIKFKYLYDIDKNMYVYYLDPDVYGNINDGFYKNGVLNINLYEARIKF